MIHAEAGLTLDPLLPISSTLGVILRSINFVLSIWVMVFSLRSIPLTPLPFQKARFLGLAMIALSFAWGTAARLHTPATYAAAGFTVSLLVSVVGTLGFLRNPRS